MEKENPKSINDSRSIQDYLSLGYLYLLVLGIFKDAIFYGFLGINIINYSNIQDILLSPIIHLTTDIKRLLIFLVGIPGAIMLMTYISKKYHLLNKEKDWYKAKKNYEKLNERFAKESSYDYLIMIIALGLFGAFIGFGVGSGENVAKRLETGKLKNNQQITFTDDKVLKVNLIGHNSEYLFYASENDTIITILPIQGNIKKIQNLE